MNKSRFFLLALVISLLLHLALLGSGLLPQQSLNPPTEAELRPIKVQMQALETSPTPASTKRDTVATLLPATTVARKNKRNSPRKVEASAAQARAKPEASAAQEEPQLAENDQMVEAPKQTGGKIKTQPSSLEDAETSTANQNSAAELDAVENTIESDGHIRPTSKLRSMPRQAKLSYQAFYGSILMGSSELNWQQEGNHYQLDTKVNPIIGPKLRYESTGEFQAASGLLPATFQAWRGSQARESARFDYAENILFYGDKGDKQVALTSGAQDIFSLSFQLALRGGQLGDAPIQITTGKKVYSYPLHPSGESDYDTGSGKIRVIIFRAKGDGDINEFWLAPDFANMPVRIRRIDSDKQIDFKISRIEINSQQQWKLPPQPTRRKQQ
ncbi:DUF3108 domain-containing protein [Neisseriaceae bacterium TC5R-5]|nr:DUF3108 domain-containing protein [Neisseriaceae bacterium TC5R-5]